MMSTCCRLAPINADEPGSVTAKPSNPDALKTLELDSDRAYGYLKDICRIGRRPSDSPGMAKQQKLIVEHFSKLGAKVSYQTFDARHPLEGTPVRMTNIIVSWHPQSRDRVLLACHYDTRPFPDADRENPRGPFVGANDGASGVSLLMELGNHMQSVKPNCGVDFVLFDGEEFVFGNDGAFFLGSEYFAKAYRDMPPAHRYRCGVVVDMIGDRKLGIYQEKGSMKLARGVTESLWSTARDLGVSEFISREKYEVNDDHLALNNIAGIPTCDVIDFDYSAWHTTRDTPGQCSGASLAKVGRVLLKWLEQVPEPKPH